MKRLFLNVTLLLLVASASQADDTGWWYAQAFRPASQTALCTVSTVDLGLKVVLMKDEKGDVLTSVAVGKDKYPGRSVVANVGGRIYRGDDGGFGPRESQDLLLDLLVGERVYVEWNQWPSGELEERSYRLTGFPLFYLACRRALSLPIPDALLDRVKTDLAPLMERLTETLGKTELVTDRSLLGLEVIRKDGKRVFFDLESYFRTSADSHLKREKWLDQWIGVHVDQQDEGRRQEGADVSDLTP